MYPDGDFRVRNVRPSAFDPLQVARNVPFGKQYRHIAPLIQRVLNEVYTVVGQLRQLLQSLFLFVQRLLFRIAHLVQTMHQLLAANVDRIR